MEHGIIDCNFFPNGCVFLTGNTRFFVLEDFQNPQISPLDKDITGTLHTWTVIPPSVSLSGQAELVLALDDTIYTMDALNLRNQKLTSGPFSAMAVSPNGKFLSVLSMNGKMSVVSTDFQQQLAEFPCSSSESPPDIHWYLDSLKGFISSQTYTHLCLLNLIGAVMMQLCFSGKILCWLLGHSVTGLNTNMTARLLFVPRLMVSAFYLPSSMNLCRKYLNLWKVSSRLGLLNTARCYTMLRIISRQVIPPFTTASKS